MFYGVDQSTPTRDSDSKNTDDAAGPSNLTLTTVAGDLCVSIHGNNAANMLNGTKQWSKAVSQVVGQMGTLLASATSTAIGWEVYGSDVAVALIPATTPGAGNDGQPTQPLAEDGEGDVGEDADHFAPADHDHEHGSLSSAGPHHIASAISYDNSSSGRAATNVQDAIDEMGTVGGGGTSLAESLLTHRMVLAAHRGDIGSADSYPEDSLPAITQAWRKGAHMCEVDVYVSSNGTWWLSHDATVDRVTNGTGTISALTDAYLSGLYYDAGEGYDAGRHGTSIGLVTLSDALDAAMAMGGMLSIEIKTGAGAGGVNSDAIATLIESKGAEDRVLLTSAGIDFHDRSTRIAYAITIATVDADVPWRYAQVSEVTSEQDILDVAPHRVFINNGVGSLTASQEQAMVADMWEYGAAAVMVNYLDDALETWRPLIYGASSVPGPHDHDDDYTRRDTLTTTGDLYYASGASTPARRAIGTEGQVLKVVSGVPNWADESGGDTSGLIPVDAGSIAYDTTTPGELGITVTSNWGHDGTDAYYDDSGATAGEEASLWFDPATGQYVVITFDFP